MSAAELIAEHVADLVRKRAEALERACEVSLLSGCCGVLETRHLDGSLTIEVTAAVPYGQHHIRDL